MGLEIVIVKHLMDKEFISMYLILGIKGIIGTIIFTIINIAFTKRQFYDLLDSILTFEYDDMLDDFEIIFIIIYIITFVILECIKIYIIIIIYYIMHIYKLYFMINKIDNNLFI